MEEELDLRFVKEHCDLEQHISEFKELYLSKNKEERIAFRTWVNQLASISHFDSGNDWGPKIKIEMVTGLVHEEGIYKRSSIAPTLLKWAIDKWDRGKEFRPPTRAITEELWDASS